MIANTISNAPSGDIIQPIITPGLPGTNPNVFTQNRTTSIAAPECTSSRNSADSGRKSSSRETASNTRLSEAIAATRSRCIHRPASSQTLANMAMPPILGTGDACRPRAFGKSRNTWPIRVRRRSWMNAAVSNIDERNAKAKTIFSVGELQRASCRF